MANANGQIQLLYDSVDPRQPTMQQTKQNCKEWPLWAPICASTSVIHCVACAIAEHFLFARTVYMHFGLACLLYALMHDLAKSYKARNKQAIYTNCKHTILLTVMLVGASWLRNDSVVIGACLCVAAFGKCFHYGIASLVMMLLVTLVACATNSVVMFIALLLMHGNFTPKQYECLTAFFQVLQQIVQ